MLKFHLFLVIVAFCCAVGKCKILDKNRQEPRKFPDGLLFGAATASYQIEGGWNEDGKTENIWDYLSHKEPCAIMNCDTGDVAANSYHFYKRDVEMMRELGLDFYRLSISWTRILPTSFPDVINEAGVQYYNNLFDEMLKYNITPMVTIYHWDLPQKLQELGGWSNPHIADWFTDYARVLFEKYGDRVKHWITINEPREVCYQGYAGKSLAPLLDISGMADYLCAKNLLVAHAKTWHLYNNEFRSTQGGTIGITISAGWFEPESDSEDDIEATEDNIQFQWGIYAHPIFSKNGDFPPVMKKRIADKSASQGFYRSRLPEFTPEEIEMVKGSSDFFGLNHYYTRVVYRNDSVYGLYESPSFMDDLDVMIYSYISNEYEGSPTAWGAIVPWGLFKLLTKIREDYDNPPIYITENGYGMAETGLQDDYRVTYYRTYLDAILNAIDEGSDVRVYTAWSLMDNFEWMYGYSQHFGIYEVDYNSPERTRTPRKSARVYKEILRTRTLDFSYEPDMSEPMTIDEGR